MITTKEMPRSGRFVAVWEGKGGLKGSEYEWRGKRLFIYGIANWFEVNISSEKYGIPENAVFITSLASDKQDLPRLELDPKWKWLWAAFDGTWYLSEIFPEKSNCEAGRYCCGDGNKELGIELDMFKFPKLAPGEDSLYEILPGGYLKKHEPEWEPKVGDFLEFCDDPAFPKVECVYAILAGIDTGDPTTPYRLGNGRWYPYCRKPQHIQLKED